MRGIVLAVGVVGSSDSFFSHDTGIDWNVIFLLLGMMIIVGVLRQTGVFEYTRDLGGQARQGLPVRGDGHADRSSPPSRRRSSTTSRPCCSIAPVTLLVCDRLDIPPVPFLIAEVLASNIGGAATLIGDPPNIIIGSRAGLSFNDFLLHMAPLSWSRWSFFILVLPGAVPRRPSP